MKFNWQLHLREEKIETRCQTVLRKIVCTKAEIKVFKKYRHFLSIFICTLSMEEEMRKLKLTLLPMPKRAVPVLISLTNKSLPIETRRQIEKKNVQPVVFRDKTDTINLNYIITFMNDNQNSQFVSYTSKIKKKWKTQLILLKLFWNRQIRGSVRYSRTVTGLVFHDDLHEMLSWRFCNWRIEQSDFFTLYKSFRNSFSDKYFSGKAGVSRAWMWRAYHLVPSFPLLSCTVRFALPHKKIGAKTFRQLNGCL